MAHFDVLTEPWIPVVNMQGERKELGVLEVLEQAPRIREIADAVITNEYGVFRFLCTFLMDALRPQRAIDLLKLYETGCFDMGAIHQYVERCRGEGVSFDLFDKKTPFLQARYNEKYDKNLVGVAKLNITMPSGNSHIHFDHHLEQQQSMTYAEAARALCAINLFCTAGAQEYPSTVNGAPPVYFIWEDKNLFKSLACSMIATKEAGNVSYDNPPVLWRNKEEVIPKTKEASISVLYGMMYPCRRVVLQPEIDGTVKKMYLCQGKNYVAYDSWKDPHVAYVFSEEGRSSIKPSMDKEPWRNITSIITREETAPIFVKRMVDQKDLVDQARVKVYCVATNQANYLDLQKSQLQMPYDIAKNETKLDRITELIQAAEIMSSELGKAIDGCYRNQEESSKSGSNNKKKKGIFREVQNIQAEFLWQCRDFILQDVFQKMAVIPEEKASQYKGECENKLRGDCMKIFDYATEMFLSTGKELVIKQKKRKELFIKISLTKKVEEKSGRN